MTIGTRKTEQVMCEVIEAATRSLIIVSYVFHNASYVIAALNEAAGRGVLSRLHSHLDALVSTTVAIKCL